MEVMEGEEIRKMRILQFMIYCGCGLYMGGF